MTGDDLRQLLASDAPAVLPGVWDPMSALVAAGAGHRALFLSGYAVAGTLLGAPDTGELTQTEMADAARRVCGAVPGVAVVVDGDTGYGGPGNVARTVELWERAGAAGVFLEDQVWPKRCGHLAGKAVVPMDEWLARLRVALARRTHLHVTARTDARAPQGLDAALDRARAAADLGVDALFVEAPGSVDELARVGAALAGRGPVLVANMVEGGRTPLLTPAELADLGFGLIVSPLSGLLAATAALASAYGELAASGTLRDASVPLVGFEDFTELVGLPERLALDALARGDAPAGEG